jgi:POT family proton-dependent oligopeptide transporter
VVPRPLIDVRAALLPEALPARAAPARAQELFGHPVGLYVLFFTEMWERFCYYGMRALLTLYVWKHLTQPEVARTVIAYGPVRHAIEAFYGPQSDKQLAYQVYGVTPRSRT